MRHVPITLGMLALALACSACGDVAEPGARPEARATDAADATLQTFTLSLDRAPTPETIIPQMVAAAHAQLAAACTEPPSTVVRVFNPMLLGRYADVPCTEILNGGAGIDEAGEVPTNERTGEAQQTWSLIGLGCSLFMGALGLFFSHFENFGCNTPNAIDPKTCRDVTDYGFFGLAFVCNFI